MENFQNHVFRTETDNLQFRIHFIELALITQFTGSHHTNRSVVSDHRAGRMAFLVQKLDFRTLRWNG